MEGIDVLQRDKVRIPVQHFDGVTIPYKSASLDVVMFIDVLHHTGDPVSLLREAARVARKSIVIKDHLFDGLLAESTLRFMDRIGNVRYGVALPCNFWRLSQWQKAFRALALTPVEWRKELGLYPKILDLWFGRPLHFPAKLEAAYSRFETSGQEIRKFIRRLRSMGAMSWDRNPAVVELFCGRGNGLVALSRLGFSKIEGVDLSPSLLSQYNGPARCHVADCRSLPFEDGSKDMIIIQGGLHHLQTLPEDLDRCLSEMHRVLKVNGKVLIVEPWSE